ncbi:MAG: hypothetical protein IKB51_07340 [Clostridia bacterium]|nr:hypothetical protein [Clostridia bacterium]
MTLSECREAARNGFPVVLNYKGCGRASRIVCQRITRIGYYYMKVGGEIREFEGVELLDFNGGCTYTADIKDLEIYHEGEDYERSCNERSA